MSKVVKAETNGERIYATLEAKQGLDMAFLVGPDKIRIPAHQLVLTSASDVFATKFSENWKSFEEGDKPTITLPSNTEEGVKAFVRGIYLDEVDSELTLDVLKELLFLAHEYMVEHLLKVCETTIIHKITVDTCLSFVEMKNLKEVSEHVFNAAWKYFIKNIPYLLGTQQKSCEVCPSYSNNWSVSTWEKILELEETPKSMSNIKEETLFQQLLKWRDLDSSREPMFIPLANLIRFPLMDPDFIVKTVIPTKILTDVDVKDILCQQKGDEVKSRTPRFKSNKRRLQVSPTEEKEQQMRLEIKRMLLDMIQHEHDNQ